LHKLKNLLLILASDPKLQ